MKPLPYSNQFAYLSERGSRIIFGDACMTGLGVLVMGVCRNNDIYYDIYYGLGLLIDSAPTDFFVQSVPPYLLEQAQAAFDAWRKVMKGLAT